MADKSTGDKRNITQNTIKYLSLRLSSSKKKYKIYLRKVTNKKQTTDDKPKSTNSIYLPSSSKKI